MQQLKRALRKEINHRLKQMDVNHRDQQSSMLQAKMLSCDPYKKATTVGVYISMPVEPITHTILTDLLRHDSGKICYVPLITEDDGTIKMFRIYDLNDLSSLRHNRWGIPEPTPFYDDGAQTIPREQPDNLDLLIVPGLAFDSKGGRLGRGKGYYDKYISKWQQLSAEKGVNMPVTVSIAFREQLVPEIPLEQHDRRIDYVIVPDDVDIHS